MIYKNIKHYKYFLLSLFGLIYSTENIIMAYIVGTLTNMATNRNYNKLPTVFLQIILAVLIVLVSGLVFNRLKYDAIRETNIKLRNKLLKGMLSSDEENSTNLGFLLNDFKLLETNRYEAEIQIMINLYTVILALSYALSLNWILTLIFLIGSVLPTIISSLFQKSIKKASNNWTKANDEYTNEVKHLLGGTEVFNLYNKQQNAVEKNKGNLYKLENSLFKLNLLNNNTNTYLNIVAIVGTFLLPFAIGIVLTIKGMTTLGALFAIVQLSNSFTNPILQILNERNNLSTTKHIVDKIDEISKEANMQSDNSTEAFSDLSATGLELFRESNVLAKDIQFSVHKGEKIAIVGPSGVGKSTLFKYLLYGKYGKADTLKLDGHEVIAGKFKDIFSYASQKSVIFPGTLWFNLTLGESWDKDKVIETCQQLGLAELVREKELDYELGDNVDKLSGGQLSRIGLARAILANRQVLLLDEINASLDKATSNQIHNYLLSSDLTIIEVIHHYEPGDLEAYDQIIDMGKYKA